MAVVGGRMLQSVTPALPPTDPNPLPPPPALPGINVVGSWQLIFYQSHDPQNPQKYDYIIRLVHAYS